MVRKIRYEGRRPGRFGRHILVDRPDLKGREAAFKVHTRKVKLSKGIDLKVLAARTPGMAGADIADVVNEASAVSRGGNGVFQRLQGKYGHGDRQGDHGDRGQGL